MDLMSLTPLFYYAVAAVLTILSLRFHRRYRILLLGPIWFFSFLSLTSVQKLPQLPGASTSFASVVVFYLPYSTKMLSLENHIVNPELSVYTWSFVDCYRIWNNPRNLPLKVRTAPGNYKSRTIFALRRAIKMATFWTFDTFVFQKILTRAFTHVVTADFAPEMELPPVTGAIQLSSHQILGRAMISIQWIWAAYYFMEFYHSLLAIAFVSILGFDEPKDWPPLFGNPLEAYSIRGFWGRFWHKLTIPTYAYYGLLISRRVFGVQPGSRLEKTMTPILVFTMSGLSHCVVGWSLGDAALSRDLFFFEINFLAAALETAVSKTKVSSSLMRLVSPLPGSFRKAAGIGWVFMFFFCVTPLWIYPKIHHALMNLMS